MDYLADLPVKESCSILERATKNGGTASCRSAVFGCEEEGRGLGEDGRGIGGRQRDLERTGTGLGEGRNNDFEEDENGTLRRKKKGL